MSDRSCGRSLGAAVLGVLIMMLSWYGPGPARGELNPADRVDETPSNRTVEPEAVENEPEGPVSPSEKEPTRRPFKRIGPQPMTPEEREEAERLRKVAAKYGTDPTAIVGRLQLTSQYLDLPQGARARDAVARVDVPYRGDWLLRVDVPFFKWIDPNLPGTTSAQGMSDLAVTAGWRVYNTPEYAVLIGALATFPTASEVRVGSGKYTAGPAIATARFLPRWDSFLIGLLQHQTSVGGDPSRRDIALSRAAAQVNSFWADKWWTIVQAVWQIDWERSAKSSMTMEFEAGRSLVGRFGAYIRPGVGIWGRDVAGAYQWNIEVGVRYMFASF
jgi:hypothetical protein